MHRRLIAVLLFAACAWPHTSWASEGAPADANPIVITGQFRPVWMITPPSTDPSPPQTHVYGIAAVRGTVLQTSDDAVTLDLSADGTELQEVRLPAGATLSTPQIPVGSLVEATGPLSGSGAMDALELKVWSSAP